MIPHRYLIERLLGEHRSLLDPEPQRQQRRERVRERQHAHGAQQARDVGELRDRGADDKRQGPVGRHHSDPDDLPATDRQRRPAEDLLADVAVDNLDADVPIHSRGDESRHDIADVGCRLISVLGDALLHGVEGVLALVAVDEQADKEIAYEDEDLCAEQRLPEVPGVAHLSEKVEKEDGAGETVHSLVDTVHCCDKPYTAAGHVGGREASVRVNGALSEVRSKGGFSSSKVRGPIRGNSHTVAV